MAKKKVRTRAQRVAAAKAAWAVRRQREELLKMKATAPMPTSSKLPAVNLVPALYTAMQTAVATREGDEYFVTVSIDGSLFRHKLSKDTLRSLGLDCIKLAA